MDLENKDKVRHAPGGDQQAAVVCPNMSASAWTATCETSTREVDDDMAFFLYWQYIFELNTCSPMLSNVD